MSPPRGTALARRSGLRRPFLAAVPQAPGDPDCVIAASSRNAGDLRARIAKARTGCGRQPFGVNVATLPKPVPGETTENTCRPIVDEDMTVVETSARDTIRTLANEATDQVVRLEQENSHVTIQKFMPPVSGKAGCAAYRSGDLSKGLLWDGHALGLTDRILPVAEIIARIEAGWVQALDRVEGVVMREAAQ